MSRRRYGYKKPRKARRLRRKYARWWASLTPGERALWTSIKEELRQGLAEEYDKQIIYGEGREPELKGISI